jgi:hypothetical protein
VVLDTNVLISATLFVGSESQKLVEELIGQRVEICGSEEILEEYEEIVNREFIVKKGQVGWKENLPSVVGQLRRQMNMIQITDRVKASRDPKDDKIIECALAGGCEYLVSYDADLLDLKEYGRVKMVKPSEMRQILARLER